MAAADIYGAIANHIAEQIAAFNGSVWVGDMPERIPKPFAVVTDGGFTTEWSFADDTDEMTWVDTGQLTVHCVSNSGDESRRLAELVKRLFASPTAGNSIPTDGSFEVMEVTRHGFSFQREPDHDEVGAVVYRYQLTFSVRAQGRY
jgi:hypothetical protein